MSAQTPYADVRTREEDGSVTGQEAQVFEHGIPGTIAAPVRLPTSAAAAAVLAAADPKRGRLAITNEADAWLCLRWDGQDPTATVYHRRVPPQGDIVFAGDGLVVAEVRGILSVGSGNAVVAREAYP
jgi:hypothetical protein